MADSSGSFLQVDDKELYERLYYEGLEATAEAWVRTTRQLLEVEAKRRWLEVALQSVATLTLPAFLMTNFFCMNVPHPELKFWIVFGLTWVVAFVSLVVLLLVCFHIFVEYPGVKCSPTLPKWLCGLIGWEVTEPNQEERREDWSGDEEAGVGNKEDEDNLYEAEQDTDEDVSSDEEDGQELDTDEDIASDEENGQELQQFS